MPADHYFSLLLPLGLAGFDPAPVLLAALFLTRHPDPAGRRTVAWFCALIVGGTALWGVFLSRLFGEQIQRIPWHSMWHWVLHAGAITVAIKLVLAFALLGYGMYALIKKTRRGAEERAENSVKSESKKAGSRRALLLFGVSFILVITTDIPFAAFVGVSGHQPLWAQVLGMLGWSLISQLPLLALLFAMVTGRDRWFTQLLQRAQARISGVLSAGIPLLCFIFAAALLSDVLLFPLVHLFIHR